MDVSESLEARGRSSEEVLAVSEDCSAEDDQAVEEWCAREDGAVEDWGAVAAEDATRPEDSWGIPEDPVPQDIPAEADPTRPGQNWSADGREVPADTGAASHAVHRTAPDGNAEVEDFDSAAEDCPVAVDADVDECVSAAEGSRVEVNAEEDDLMGVDAEDEFLSAAEGGPVEVEAAGRCGYVWTVAAARRLRRLGVPGQLAGCLPRAPRQAAQLGLPLMLSTEEMHTLSQQGLCRVVRYPELAAPRPAAQRRLLAERERTSVAAQQRQMTLARHKQLLERADQIADGKWRKLAKQRAAGRDVPDVTRDQLRLEFVEQLRARVRPPPEAQCYRQLYCGHPLAVRPEGAPLPPPAGAAERARRAVYADLWRRGYRLTDGLKFGGDFLAYEGDPLVVHAALVVRCVARRPHPRDLAALQRLAAGCGKTLLVSWLDADGAVLHETVSRDTVRLRPLAPERGRERSELVQDGPAAAGEMEEVVTGGGVSADAATDS